MMMMMYDECQNSGGSDDRQPRQRGRLTGKSGENQFVENTQVVTPFRTGYVLEKPLHGDAFGQGFAKFLHGLGDKRAELQRSIELAIFLKRVESMHHCILGQNITILHVESRRILWMHRLH